MRSFTLNPGPPFGHGNSLYRDVQARARAKLEELYARL